MVAALTGRNYVKRGYTAPTTYTVTQVCYPCIMDYTTMQRVCQCNLKWPFKYLHLISGAREDKVNSEGKHIGNVIVFYLTHHGV